LPAPPSPLAPPLASPVPPPQNKAPYPQVKPKPGKVFLKTHSAVFQKPTQKKPPFRAKEEKIIPQKKGKKKKGAGGPPLQRARAPSPPPLGRPYAREQNSLFKPFLCDGRLGGRPAPPQKKIGKIRKSQSPPGICVPPFRCRPGLLNMSPVPQNRKSFPPEGGKKKPGPPPPGRKTNGERQFVRPPRKKRKKRKNNS